LPTSPSDVKSVTSKRGSPPDDGPVCFTIREENGVFVSRSKRSEIILVKTVKSEHWIWNFCEDFLNFWNHSQQMRSRFSLRRAKFEAALRPNHGKWDHGPNKWF
jgi:hypothetical protein